MNIFFRQDGNDIVAAVTFHPANPGDVTFKFRWEAGDKSLASIAAAHIQTQLDAHSKKIRETSYQQGWQDAKQKKAKRTFFGWSIGYVERDVK